MPSTKHTHNFLSLSCALLWLLSFCPILRIADPCRSAGGRPITPGISSDPHQLSPAQGCGSAQLHCTCRHTHLHTLFSLEVSTGGFADWFTLEDDEGILHFASHSSLWLLDTDPNLRQRQTKAQIEWTVLWRKNKVKGLFTIMRILAWKMCSTRFWNVAMHITASEISALLNTFDFEVFPGLMTTLKFHSTSLYHCNFKEAYSSLKPSKPNKITIYIFFLISMEHWVKSKWGINHKKIVLVLKTKTCGHYHFKSFPLLLSYGIINCYYYMTGSYICIYIWWLTWYQFYNLTFINLITNQIIIN